MSLRNFKERGVKNNEYFKNKIFFIGNFSKKHIMQKYIEFPDLYYIIKIKFCQEKIKYLYKTIMKKIIVL